LSPELTSLKQLLAGGLLVGLFADPNIIVYFGAGSAANVSYAGLFYGNPRQPPGRHHDRGIRRADIPKPEPAHLPGAHLVRRVQGLGAGCRSGWDQNNGPPVLGGAKSSTVAALAPLA
jgi:hypothetical protein